MIDWEGLQGSHAFLMDNMQLMAGMPDGWADVAVIDPEYGINAGEGIGRSNRVRIGNNKKHWDKQPPPAAFWAEIFRVSRAQVIWGGNYFLDYLRASRCFYVWDKCNAGRDFADCEMAWVSWDAVARMLKYRVANDAAERFHSTQKPVHVYSWIYAQIRKTLEPSLRLSRPLRVLDTNLGSGTNRIAAHPYGHTFVGCEIDGEIFQQAEDYYKLKTAQKQLYAPDPVKIISAGDLFNVNKS